MSENIHTDFSNRRRWGPDPKYPLVREYKRLFDHKLITVAGPCSVESSDQIQSIANVLGKCGIRYLRGGVFRAGTYPGNNFGLVNEGLIRSFSDAAKLNSMDCVIEVLDYREPTFGIVLKYADVIQIGARHMQDYSLLHYVGQTGKPVFLKRNMGSTLDEFLGAAEHLLASGTKELVLIERGSSTFHNHVRWDLSISMIPAVKSITNIPIIVDASHGTGRRDFVKPMTMAGIAAGADGFLIETHADPKNSLSDADQAYPIYQFLPLVRSVFALKTTLMEINKNEM